MIQSCRVSLCCRHPSLVVLVGKLVAHAHISTASLPLSLCSQYHLLMPSVAVREPLALQQCHRDLYDTVEPSGNDACHSGCACRYGTLWVLSYTLPAGCVLVNGMHHTHHNLRALPAPWQHCGSAVAGILAACCNASMLQCIHPIAGWPRASWYL